MTHLGCLPTAATTPAPSLCQLTPALTYPEECLEELRVSRRLVGVLVRVVKPLFSVRKALYNHLIEACAAPTIDYGESRNWTLNTKSARTDTSARRSPQRAPTCPTFCSGPACYSWGWGFSVARSRRKFGHTRQINRKWFSRGIPSNDRLRMPPRETPPPGRPPHRLPHPDLSACLPRLLRSRSNPGSIN